LDCLNPSGTAPELTEEVESRLADDSRFNKTFNGDINTFADTLVRIHDRFRDLYTEAAGGDQSLLEPLSAYHTELSARLSKSIGERETLTADEEAKREARRSEFQKEQAQHASKVSAYRSTRKAAEMETAGTC
jgi:hypothetical protein